MQWHTTYEAQRVTEYHQREMQRRAENHRWVKAAREQRRQQKLAEEPAPRQSRLVRALNRALHPMG